MATPHVQYVTGEAALSASLAAAATGSVVQVDALGGGSFPTSASYLTGYENHQGAPSASLDIALPDTRTFRIIWNS